MMREISPYRHVNAPHVVGYFKTLDARFTITPLADGKTRLSLATRHELDLEPALYWAPIAEWATHENKVRVLEHFRRQAEAHRAAPLTDTPKTPGSRVARPTAPRRGGARVRPPESLRLSRRQWATKRRRRATIRQ